MIKEETRFAASNIMEGMTSISSLLNCKCDNDRKIIKILYNENKDSCLSFQHLKTFSEKFNYKECKNRKCVEFIDSILKRKTDCNICQNDDCTEKKKAS